MVLSVLEIFGLWLIVVRNFNTQNSSHFLQTGIINDWNQLNTYFVELSVLDIKKEWN